jgi:hypothetical protein
MFDGALVLLGCAGFILLSCLIAYLIYVAVQWLGFGDNAASWPAFIFLAVMGVLFYRISRDTLARWALTFFGFAPMADWCLFAANGRRRRRGCPCAGR